MKITIKTTVPIFVLCFLCFLFLLFFSAIVSAKSLPITELQRLERTYGIKINDLQYSTDTGKHTGQFLRDSSDALRSVDTGNFLLREENSQFKAIQEQMKLSGGSRVGNGGDVTVCNEGKDITFFDFQRAIQFNSSDLQIRNESSYDESLNKITNKLLQTYPYLGEDLKNFYAQFEERKKFNQLVFWKPETTLINVKDEMLTAKLPKGCQLVQAVIRLKTKRKIFFYNRDIVNRLKSENNQLSWLIVHEWLWDYLNNASDLRDVNHFLHSYAFLNATEKEIHDFLTKLGFKIKNQSSFTAIMKRKELNQHIARTILDKTADFLSDSNKTDLEYFRLYKDLTDNLRLLDTNSITRELKNKTIASITTLTRTRLSDLSSRKGIELEKSYLKQINKRLSSPVLIYPLRLICGEYSLFRMKILSHMVHAKIYLQKRTIIFPFFGWREKLLKRMEKLDSQLHDSNITVQEYFIRLFEITNNTLPDEFALL